METSARHKSPRTARIKAAKALKKVPIASLLKKKVECDAKALKIVEKMLEPGIDVDWLLQNLSWINKSHMEDVAEERSIVKLCGYVLCDNPLTRVTKKQYQISTATNKVYDLSKVQNYCSYSCYKSADYLMEQMLTSPLWLRDQEEIPKFQTLPKKSREGRYSSPPGVEVDLIGIQLPDESNEQKEKSESDIEKEGRKEKKLERSERRQKERRKVEPVEKKKHGTKAEGGGEQELADKKEEEREDKKVDEEKSLESFEKKISTEKFEKDGAASLGEERKRKNSEDQVTDVTEQVGKTLTIDTEFASSLQTEEWKSTFNKDAMIPQKNSELSASTTISSEDDKFAEEMKNSASIPPGAESSKILPADATNVPKSKETLKKKTERRKSREPRKILSFDTLTSRVEKSFKEWITDKTVRLLHGESVEKEEIMENSKREEKYAILCKKLSRLQVEEELEAKERVGELKPAPNFLALQEEAKSMELKIGAYWKGKMTLDPDEVPEKPANEEENQVQPNLPLLDLHAPNALRRRIFLDKLNSVLPDILRALSGQTSDTRITYNSERTTMVKALVGTFALSASNIIFKSVEWTLIALIITKLLGIMDPRTKYLLGRKQASTYISMILMSYQLESNYLDNFIASLTTPTNKREIENTESLIES